MFTGGNWGTKRQGCNCMKAIDITVEKFYAIDFKWSCVVQTIVSSAPRRNRSQLPLRFLCRMPLPATSISVLHFGLSVVQKGVDNLKEFQMWCILHCYCLAGCGWYIHPSDHGECCTSGPDISWFEMCEVKGSSAAGWLVGWMGNWGGMFRLRSTILRTLCLLVCSRLEALTQ